MWGLPTPEQVIAQVQSIGTNITQMVVNQIVGIQRNLADLSADLARIFGIRQEVITVAGPYGNPTADAQYWVSSNYATASLATIAMAYAQLTGTAVDLAGFITMAENTYSLYKNNQKMYGPGLTAWINDSYELLQDKGFRIFNSYYTNDGQSAALHDLTDNLQNPGKVMMVTLSGPVDGLTGTYTKSVIVLGVDTETGIVRLNDPTLPNGQDMTMSLDDFQSAWQSSNYRLVSAQLNANAATPTTVPAPAVTRLVWSLPTPDQFGRVLSDLAVNITTTVAHQVQGISRNLSDFGNDLATVLGVGQQTSTVVPPSPSDTEFGNYAANKQYWIYQGQLQSCVLMAVAGVIGQLTGTMPTEEAILDLARSTASDSVADEMIFEGDGQVPGMHYGTFYVDAVKLLNKYGLNADMSQYTKGQGDLALDDLKGALSDGQGVIVSVNNQTIYNGYLSKYLGKNLFTINGIAEGNHGVIVLAVDVTKNLVYLNDSAVKDGQGFPVPLDKFMTAWQASRYTMVTAERPTASAAPAYTAMSIAA